MARLEEPDYRRMITDWQEMADIYRRAGDTANLERVERLIEQTTEILDRGLTPLRVHVVRVRD